MKEDIKKLNSFLKSINYGQDGVVRKITIGENLTFVKIEIETMDFDNKQKWIDMEFAMEGVCEFNILQKQNTEISVLSMGVIFKQFGDVLYLCFQPYSSEIDTLNDIRKSDIYFGFKSVKVSEIQNSN